CRSRPVLRNRPFALSRAGSNQRQTNRQLGTLVRQARGRAMHEDVSAVGVVDATTHVTLLFTDIEASTRAWEDGRTAMSLALARHDELLHAAVQANGGAVFKHTGDG